MGVDEIAPCILFSGYLNIPSRPLLWPSILPYAHSRSRSLYFLLVQNPPFLTTLIPKTPNGNLLDFPLPFVDHLIVSLLLAIPDPLPIYSLLPFLYPPPLALFPAPEYAFLFFCWFSLFYIFFKI